MRTRRVQRFCTAVALVAMAACHSDVTSPTNRGYGEAYDAMWAAFDTQYPYFDFKQVDWNAQRAAHRSQAASATTINEFLSVVRESVLPLRDGHVWFEDPTGATQPIYLSTAFVNWDRTVWLRYMTNASYRQVKPNLVTTEIDGVPYLMVGQWNGNQFSVEDLDGVLEMYKGRRAMIIDVRPNTGGTDQLALALAGRFTTQTVTGEYLQYRSGPKHSDLTPEQARRLGPRGSWQFTGPVYLLTGRASASSNESFVSFMRELPNVTVVGDTTAGMTGNPAPVDLTAGWKIWVPRWIARTAQHEIVEWNGIAPDIFVPSSPADFAAGSDPVLDYAIAALRAGAPDLSSSASLRKRSQ